MNLYYDMQPPYIRIILKAMFYEQFFLVPSILWIIKT